MTCLWPFAGSLLAGPLCSTSEWPYTLYTRCCDLRPRFLIKPAIQSAYRAVARNGRILLCTDRPLEQLPDRIVRLRLQTWHRIYLPGDAPQPHGLLLHVRAFDGEEENAPRFTMLLEKTSEARGELRIDVGGGMLLDFVARRDSNG